VTVFHFVAIHSVAFKANHDGSLKRRLVLDLSRHVNKLIPDSKFCMTTFGDALTQTSKRDFQYVFDLEAAYHHCRLSPESYKYVGFCVDSGAGEEFYCFCVLVFGLKPAGQILGRLLKPVLVFLAQQGIWLSVYIDDGRGLAVSKAKADDDYALVVCSICRQWQQLLVTLLTLQLLHIALMGFPRLSSFLL
jgi:hypothetical protein